MLVLVAVAYVILLLPGAMVGPCTYCKAELCLTWTFLGMTLLEQNTNQFIDSDSCNSLDISFVSAQTL